MEITGVSIIYQGFARPTRGLPIPFDQVQKESGGRVDAFQAWKRKAGALVAG